MGLQYPGTGTITKTFTRDDTYMDWGGQETWRAQALHHWTALPKRAHRSPCATSATRSAESKDPFNL